MDRFALYITLFALLVVAEPLGQLIGWLIGIGLLPVVVIAGAVGTCIMIGFLRKGSALATEVRRTTAGATLSAETKILKGEI